MSKYTPDYFSIIKIVEKEDTYYKVFGTWSGSYLEGDHWRVSTRIVDVKLVGQCYQFFGASGSCYEVHKDTYGANAYTSQVMRGMVEKSNLSQRYTAEIMDSSTDWTQLEF